MYADARHTIHHALALAFAPRKALTVSEWADLEVVLSTKSSPEPGPWRTARNPILKEPMDCMSARSHISDVVLMFPVQLGKSEVGRNTVGYWMAQAAGPIMVCLPGEVSMKKWIYQKLDTMIEETPAVAAALLSTKSRDARNSRDFKDFKGGQLYLEHAGNPSRLKSTSVKIMVNDELDEFAANNHTGDDPVMMCDDRTTAYSSSGKRMYCSSPQIEGISRIKRLYEKSDQRKYYVPCPHCGHEQPLIWAGLHWDTDGKNVHYVCRDCGVLIHEHEKTEMIEKGRWVPENPGAKIRGYHANCLYYPIGLGKRWDDLVEMWLAAQNDQAELKTFINSRLAETWEDPAMRRLKQNAIADRAEAYPLRYAPQGVCAITAGWDTQDDRLEGQVVGWGAFGRWWILDYIVLNGDPAEEAVWAAFIDYANTPLEREDGAKLPILANAIDMLGHRTEAVKDFVRRRLVKRPMATYGAISNNAPVLGRAKAQDVNWRGRYDKKGVHTYQVGTVGIKHKLFSQMSVDADKPPEQRHGHFSQDLPPEYFAGIISETYDPRLNRFIKKRGARNEPIDTLTYAYAATHHPELRLHLYSAARWAELGKKSIQAADSAVKPSGLFIPE